MSLDAIEYLARHEQKDLLRFVVVGSVDDGKSTLIGRLLHDVGALADDQLSAVRRASKMEGAEIDFSLFTDGLIAEREQGITIDVAYRYFSTKARKYIIADTPGHEQYTRNMATGASTAQLAIVLIDARYGLLTQTRRHAFIASLLGISDLVVAINKMDTVGYAQDTFDTIARDVDAFVKPLAFRAVHTVALSAARGDNVVVRSSAMPWHTGPTLLELLETTKAQNDEGERPLRLPVQLVIRPNLDYRGFAGQIASGRIRKNERVSVFPSGRESRVVAIETPRGEVDEAVAPESVVVRLADEIDISRGDVLASEHSAPQVASSWIAHVVWMSAQPLDTRKSYWVKIGTRSVRATIRRVLSRINLETLTQEPATKVTLNTIAKAEFQGQRPLVMDSYEANRTLGSFILIDPLTNDTVGAGMIDTVTKPTKPSGAVTKSERKDRLGHTGLVVTAPDEPTAHEIERALFDRGIFCAVVAPKAAQPSAQAGIVAITVGKAEGKSFTIRDSSSVSVDAIVQEVSREEQDQDQDPTSSAKPTPSSTT